MKRNLLFVTLVVTFTASGIAYAVINHNPREDEITNYKPGHWHDEHGTHDALQHSGGTDAYGCHNGSVPYHCH